MIGHIDLYDDYTFVDVPAEYVRDIMSAMKNQQDQGQKSKYRNSEEKIIKRLVAPAALKRRVFLCISLAEYFYF